MIVDLDECLRKSREDSYDCLDLACDVWRKFHPHDTRLDELRDARNHDPSRYPSIEKKFIKLSKPKSPCVVLMHYTGKEPHIGIYIEDRVLHMSKHCVKSDLLLAVQASYSCVDFYR